MATNTVGLALTTSMQDIGSAVPSGKVRYYTMIHVANVDGTNDVDATVQWTDASNSNTAYKLVHNLTVAKKDARPAMVGALALAAGDKLQGQASADGDAVVTATYYEEDA